MRRLRLVLWSAAWVFAVMYALDVTGVLSMIRVVVWYYYGTGEPPR